MTKIGTVWLFGDDIDTDILRLFNLIFENYYDKNIQELIVEYPNVEV